MSIALENYFSQELATPIMLAFIANGDDHHAGRVALALVRHRLHLPKEPFSPPHSNLSITHEDGRAFAAGTPAATRGLGVDWEAKRAPRPESVRFFLREEEYVGKEFTRDELSRLWCVKEALFKADPDNLGRSLCDYVVADPRAIVGLAKGLDGKNYRYATTSEGVEGMLAIAICMPEGAP